MPFASGTRPRAVALNAAVLRSAVLLGSFPAPECSLRISARSNPFGLAVSILPAINVRAPARLRIAHLVWAALGLLAAGCGPSARDMSSTPSSSNVQATASVVVVGHDVTKAGEDDTGDDAGAAGDLDAESHEFTEGLTPPARHDDDEDEEPQGAAHDVERAVDAVAAEIVEGLRLRPVTVVWLVDATPSAAALRQRVIERLQIIYGQFDRSTKRSETFHPLYSAAVAFGEHAEFLLPEPTQEGKLLVEALATLGDDPSGVENTFAAMRLAFDRYVADAAAARKYAIFVVATDEVGDDLGEVDEVARRLEQAVVPVYVIGSPAPFGDEPSLAPVVEVENWQPVRQGPESRYLEQVPAPAGDPSRHAARLDSGCGSFALTYLTRKTAGEYFIVRTDEAETVRGLRLGPESDVVRFEPRVVASHLPDYVSEEEYQRLLSENKARMAVNRAAKLPKVVLPPELKREFAVPDPAALKRQLDDAQRGVAKLQPQLRKLYDTLAAGEADRGRLKSPRWQAEYDLALGRILAARARWEGYNAMLAVLKSRSTFTRPGSSRWVLVEADTFAEDSNLNRLAGQARRNFERVVSEHAGTPWAWLAERELAIPVAWKWEER